MTRFDDQFDPEPWPEVYESEVTWNGLVNFARRYGKQLAVAGAAMHTAMEDLIQQSQKRKTRSMFVLVPNDLNPPKPEPRTVVKPKPYWQQGPAYDRRGRKRF